MAVTQAIAILGWGSLLWDLDDLEPKVEGRWLLRAGPRLPMEFSRVSVKRRLALAVCLDAEAGTSCATSAIRSRRLSLTDARQDLANRERAPAARIGWASAEGDGESRLEELPRVIGSWCRTAGWSGAVWTDLEPNFAEHTGEDFSVAAARRYLWGLTSHSLEEAHRYIRNAPLSTRTPLRRALARDPWWRGLKAKLP